MKSIFKKYLVTLTQKGRVFQQRRNLMLLTGSTALIFGMLQYYQQQPQSFLKLSPLAQAEEKTKDPYLRTRMKEKISEDALIVPGSSNQELAKSIAEHLGTNLANTTHIRFADGETFVRVNDNVCGKHIYIIQPTCPPVNENFMELVLLISACKRAGAAKVTCIIPYYGYARQDRKFQGQNVPVSGADVAYILEQMGADRIISVDLHVSQAQGFVSPKVTFDNLEGAFAGLSFFLKEIPNKNEIVVVSPDAGGLGRAKSFHKHFEYHGYGGQVGLAMINKERKEANKIEKMELVGNVDGKVCIIIDDMIDTAGTLCEAAHLLKEKGAKKVYAFASHGLFSGQAADRIKRSDLEKVITTDSIPAKKEFKDTVGDKHLQISLDLLLAETIRRIDQKEGLKELFTIPVY